MMKLMEGDDTANRTSPIASSLPVYCGHGYLASFIAVGTQMPVWPSVWDGYNQQQATFVLVNSRILRRFC